MTPYIRAGPDGIEWGGDPDPEAEGRRCATCENSAFVIEALPFGYYDRLRDRDGTDGTDYWVFGEPYLALCAECFVRMDTHPREDFLASVGPDDLLDGEQLYGSSYSTEEASDE